MSYVYYDVTVYYGPSNATSTEGLTLIQSTRLPIITGLSPVPGEYTYDDFGLEMSRCLGISYSYMDGVGRLTGGPSIATARLWFPGLDFTFSEVNAFLATGPSFSGRALWYVVPKMHRVFKTFSDTTNPSLFRLNSDNSFTGLSIDSAWHIIPGIISRQNLLWFVSRGETVEDFIDANNWSREYSLTFNVSDPAVTRTLALTTTRNLTANTLQAIFGDAEEPEIMATDPYSPGGESGTGGGTGNFDGTGDNIDIPSLPTLSAVDTGFITLFNPTLAQLNDLASYMWTNPLFDPANWRKLFADPMDAILGLSIVPVAVPDGGTSAVTVGNISTGVSMTKAARQYVEVDCGTLNVNEYWGAYLDYDPYTKAEIYLPYIGTHALAVDDIMGKPVHVVYHVDILSGACAAFVKCGGSVLYTFIGQCSSSIPISGNDWTNVINGVLSIAGSVGSMVAVGGAAAPLVAPALASSAINSIKPNVEKSGSLAGTGGMLGVQTPYLILTRPRQALPARQNQYTGYPSFITRKLAGLNGYTEISDIHLENVPATEQELSEIVNLLKGGVIL